LPPAALRGWERLQSRRRQKLAHESIDIELNSFAGIDIHNFPTCLRAQAFDEKLKAREKYKPKLEEEMRELLDAKLDPDLYPHGQSISTGQTQRSLRQSTSRRRPKIPGPMPTRLLSPPLLLKLKANS